MMVISLVALSFALPVTSFAQAPGECASGFCGTPRDVGGGGGGGGGGSILINNTDMGETYSTSDDFDADGFEDDFDNCPFIQNRDQLDTDADSFGDGCDNAPLLVNADQSDVDGDGVGDVVDEDIDNDGLPNAGDNCPNIPNPSQRATTAGLGDACNPDDDNDGLRDTEDPCPKIAGQTAGAGCDDDEDGDGILDGADNCPSVANTNQLNLDADGIGDLCDVDLDGDGVPNITDNADRVANPDQLDDDRDGIGNAADPEFCYVFDPQQRDACLNPSDTFKVATIAVGTGSSVRSGTEFRMLLLANRENTAIRYTYTVSRRPDDSRAVVANSVGMVQVSEAFEYRMGDAARVPVFVPDEAGEYEIQLSAELMSDDTAYPGGPRTATYRVALKVDSGGDDSGGCTSTGRPALGTSLFLLAGLAFLRRSREKSGRVA